MQQQPTFSLPAPDAESAAHSARVAALLREKIAAAGGKISFAEYMQHALYAPGLGYYVAGSSKFGAAGDFVTAPEVSPLFGRVLARQCAAVLAEVPESGILEFGAGSGRLAVDLLLALAALDALPDRYSILEVSPDLRQRQETLLRDALPDYFAQIAWLQQLPERHAGVIIANEVLDAMPCERFIRRGDTVTQLCVGVQNGEFVPVERTAPKFLVDAVSALEQQLGRPLPDAYASDICLAASQWLGAVADVLDRGFIFLFDYGLSRSEYYAADRSSGWLKCHFRHHAHANPLILPGIQDITAWVDFSAMADAAYDHGLEIGGYVTQAQFLIHGGLADELVDIAELPLAAQLDLSRQVKLLTLPGEMGENFKCLGLRRGAATPIAFFEADRTVTL